MQWKETTAIHVRMLEIHLTNAEAEELQKELQNFAPNTPFMKRLNLTISKYLEDKKKGDLK